MVKKAEWRSGYLLPIGKRLKELRAQAGLTQLDLSRKTGIAISMVAGMEQRGDVDVLTSTVAALAAALKVRPAALLEPPVAGAEDGAPEKRRKRGG